MTTPNLELPEVPQAILGASDEINAGFKKLDVIVQLAVIDKDLTAPPDSVVQGAKYIVASPATGDWTGREGRIAYMTPSGWSFSTPREGWFAWVSDEEALYWYQQSTSQWVLYEPNGGGGGGGSSIGAELRWSGSQSTSLDVSHIVEFDTVVEDDGEFFDEDEPTRLTAPRAGWYMVSGSVRWTSTTAATRRGCFFTKNGVDVGLGTQYGRLGVEAVAQTGYATDLATSSVIYLEEGDYVEFKVYHSHSSSLSFTAASFLIASIG